MYLYFTLELMSSFLMYWSKKEHALSQNLIQLSVAGFSRLTCRKRLSDEQKKANNPPSNTRDQLGSLRFDDGNVNDNATN